MCGRYHFRVRDDPQGKKIKERTKKLDLTYKTGEIFPNDKVLCVIPVGSSLDLAVRKWGMKRSHFQINARIESVREYRSYRELKDKRCAVLCDGFYEWDKEKNKYLISFKEYLYLACICNDDELLILTRDADEDFRHIHEREPLIMDHEEMERYIHGEDIVPSRKDCDIKMLDEEIKLF